MPRAGGHQVHRAGGDVERVALAVAMGDAAIEQVGDGRQADMRVRPHVHALAGHELHRSHLVEEDEGANHLPLHLRQRAADREAAQVAHSRHHHEVQRIAGCGIAKYRVVRRHPAHGPRSSEWVGHLGLPASDCVACSARARRPRRPRGAERRGFPGGRESAETRRTMPGVVSSRGRLAASLREAAAPRRRSMLWDKPLVRIRTDDGVSHQGLVSFCMRQRCMGSDRGRRRKPRCPVSQ